MNKEAKPLYRKVNTRARHVWHNKGSEARYDRNTKTGLEKSMKQGKQRGLDYTPLYMFLLSKVGQDWDKVHSEAVARLKGADVDAVYNMVLVDDQQGHGYGYFNGGESSKYSTLFIDENNLLQKTHPDLKNEDLEPSCSCCTHTFNGKVLTVPHSVVNKRY